VCGLAQFETVGRSRRGSLVDGSALLDGRFGSIFPKREASTEFGSFCDSGASVDEVGAVAMLGNFRSDRRDRRHIVRSPIRDRFDHAGCRSWRVNMARCGEDFLTHRGPLIAMIALNQYCEGAKLKRNKWVMMCGGNAAMRGLAPRRLPPAMRQEAAFMDR